MVGMHLCVRALGWNANSKVGMGSYTSCGLWHCSVRSGRGCLVSGLCAGASGVLEGSSQPPNQGLAPSPPAFVMVGRAVGARAAPTGSVHHLSMGVLPSASMSPHQPGNGIQFFDQGRNTAPCHPHREQHGRA